jgi:hypothetical protein
MRPLHVCRFLSAKDYYLPPPLDPEEAKKPPRTAFWCGKTHMPVGPDGGDAREERCCAGRPCFEPQIRL